MTAHQLPTVDLARGRLHRAIVSLPQSMCKREQPFQERIVFFEGPAQGAGEHLATLLGLVWGVNTTDWCARGLIYNVSSARELIVENLSDSQDARLLEIGWGGDIPIHYACSADVDMLVTPQVKERLQAGLRATAATGDSVHDRDLMPRRGHAGGEA